MNNETSNLRTFVIVATVALFLAVIPVWPYGFYTLLRLLVCGVSAYFAYKIKDLEGLKTHKVPLIVIAILFNPLIPVHLVRTIWLPIDVGVGIYFIVLIGQLNKEETK